MRSQKGMRAAVLGALLYLACVHGQAADGTNDHVCTKEMYKQKCKTEPGPDANLAVCGMLEGACKKCPCEVKGQPSVDGHVVLNSKWGEDVDGLTYGKGGYGNDFAESEGSSSSSTSTSTSTSTASTTSSPEADAEDAIDPGSDQGASTTTEEEAKSTSIPTIVVPTVLVVSVMVVLAIYFTKIKKGASRNGASSSATDDSSLFPFPPADQFEL
jgi:hypothetical protein